MAVALLKHAAVLDAAALPSAEAPCPRWCVEHVLDDPDDGVFVVHRREVVNGEIDQGVQVFREEPGGAPAARVEGWDEMDAAGVTDLIGALGNALALLEEVRK